jgi:hypothetical protein
MFNSLKDRVTGKAARMHCNQLLERYGTVQDLRIDSARRSMEIVCLLEGETSPITVTVERYEITDAGGDKFVHIGASRCSRPWVQHFLEDHLYGRKFPLPAWAAAAL